MTIEVAPGELHGLVGQNGSGKSTFAKVLTGYHAPDRGGRLSVDGVELSFPVQPVELKRHGVAVVHQALGLVDEFTVIENLRLGRYGSRRLSRRIDWGAERDAVRGVLDRLDFDVDLDATVASLSAEARATLGIARALQDHTAGSGLIIFDESTRALSRDLLDRFYALVRGVLDSGASVLLICHRLEEVLDHCDRVSVLRDGQVAAAGLDTKGLSEAELTRAMLGYSLERRATRQGATAPSATGGMVAEGVSSTAIAPLDLRVAAGEIVGLTGLAGSGFEEVPYLLAGANPASAGRLTVGSEVVELGGPVGRCAELLAVGVSLVPDRRDVIGLALDQSVKENITLPRVRARSRRLLVGRAWEHQEVSMMISRLDIRPPELDMLVGSLSGGNQQKVLLAKWLAGQPALLLLHEPTQAVDVGARQDILQAIEDTAASGCAVVIASTDPEELAAVCDRVLVFHDGAVIDELTGRLTPDGIIESTFRQARPDAAHRTTDAKED